MKLLPSIATILVIAANAFAERNVAEFSWKNPTSVPRGTSAVMIDGRAALKIDNTNDAPLRVALLTVNKPKISALLYAIKGEVRYQSVKGDGFLEMWNYFPSLKPGLPEGQYFSRTLGDSGDMGKITGASDWRPFLLPFDSTGASGAPTKLQINLILGGRGTVYLDSFELVEYPAAKSFTTGWNSGSESKKAWWSDRTAGLFGGLAGSIFGVLGALVGTLSSMGRARGFVLSVLKIQIVLGIACGIAGTIALITHQPYAVFYPLLLLGILLGSICGGLLPQVTKKYQELELRRMQSFDTAG